MKKLLIALSLIFMPMSVFAEETTDDSTTEVEVKEAKADKRDHREGRKGEVRSREVRERNVEAKIVREAARARHEEKKEDRAAKRAERKG